jgi:imidazole glycerol-phosphate synthase subunit HisH
MITIVDYGVGNIASLVNMFDHLGYPATVSSDPHVVSRASKLILPGIGAFDKAMATLAQCDLVKPIQDATNNNTQLLGICLGMQLLGNRSAEGERAGLGLIDADVVRIERATDSTRKVPHMGWAEISVTRKSPIFPDMSAHERYYFAHSYHMKCKKPDDVTATIDYDSALCVAVSHGNVHGAQFHPEKSHRFGMRLLSTFAEL